MSTLTGRPAIEDHPTIDEADDAETRLAASLAREQTLVARLQMVTVERDSLKRLLTSYTPSPYELTWMQRHPGVVMALGGLSALVVFAVGLVLNRMFWPN
ncbi:hypothetical protein KX816_10090 [Sphingosinicellaceae bacterium]|nr:hypothetical protein KX816_10090 [Sphingosinicellaceae bacterium]